jgi:hypothetical protein
MPCSEERAQLFGSRAEDDRIAARVKARDQVVAEIGGPDALQDGGADELTATPNRFCLVERNYRYGRGYWVTTWDTADLAGRYVTGQEYAEDWETIILVDLDTGDRYEASLTLTWHDQATGFAFGEGPAR